MKNNKKGFTLAELLVVVGIIAVLIAIAIPVFSGQVEKASEAVDAANIRSAYAELLTEQLTGEAEDKVVELTQGTDGWVQNFDWPNNLVGADGEVPAGGTATLSYEESLTLNDGTTGDGVQVTYAAAEE